MKIPATLFVLVLLLQCGDILGQDQLKLSLRMQQDTARAMSDLRFTYSIQSDYNGRILLAPSKNNGIIRDTAKFVYYQVQALSGKEYEDVSPEIYPEDKLPLIKNEPDTLAKGAVRKYTDAPVTYNFKKGKYRMRIEVKFCMGRECKTAFSNWVYFYAAGEIH